MKLSSAKWLGLAVIATVCAAVTPAQASIVVNGITYTLIEQESANPLTDLFTLNIGGINALTDTEGGRYGVQSFAFNPPTGFISATAPSGFTTLSGGLNADGCNGAGNFFCFSANSTPNVLLPPDSNLSFNFTVTAGSFAGYDPDFKVNWAGTKNNYNLVSVPLSPTGAPPTSVPEPGPLVLLVAGLAALALMQRRRATA